MTSERQTFDIVVIGGGINGAAIARDASLRGYRVLLLERDDFGSGTSSWSSRLIHGGLRYLEHLEFDLVRESLRERAALLRNAPHLVRPLELLIPIRRESARGPLAIRAGLTIYDVFARAGTLPRHRVLGPAEAIARVPGLDPEALRAAASYHDAQVEYAERLVIENILDARDTGRCVLHNHTPVETVLLENGRAVGVRYRTPDDIEHEARAAVIFNVAGPWVDSVLPEPARAREPLIGGTKGTHIVVERFPGAPTIGVYTESTTDGRPLFILPWDGRILIGTTDIPAPGDPDTQHATRDEIDYLLHATNNSFPGAELSDNDVLLAYCGVRPLPHVSASRPGAITRRHFCHEHDAPARGLVSVIGGKLTTHRSLAEEAVDAIRGLGVSDPTDPVDHDCQTADRPLPGAAGWGPGTDNPLERRLARIYGGRRTLLHELIASAPALDTPLGRRPDTLGAEVVHAVRHEMAHSLVDVLYRRMMVGYGADRGLAIADHAAQIASEHLGWSDERCADELERVSRHAASLAPPSRDV